MTLPLWLALGDAAVGIYLVVYDVRRERRDKPAMLVTSFVLLACAAALDVLGLSEALHSDKPGLLPPPAGNLA